jgi:hypothetical protein
MDTNLSVNQEGEETKDAQKGQKDQLNLEG